MSELPRIAVILAAGQGTRMRSRLAKPLHEVAGRPMLAWVIDAARQAGCSRILAVVGHQAEAVQAAFADQDVEWILQEEQLGTGHALAQAEARLGEGDLDGREALLMVLNGDVPGLRAETLERLAAEAEAGWGAMAVADLETPGSLGRVIARPGGGELERIVEARDASAEELAITCINVGFYAVRAPRVFDDLRRVGTDNAQGEIYLTDAMGLAATSGDRPVRLVELEDVEEAFGINDRRDLARAHRALIDRHLERLMAEGVTFLDPASTTVEPTVEVGADSVIHPHVSLLGKTRIGPECEIHAGCWVRDSQIAARALLRPYSVLEEADVGPRCTVGPFARLRPGAAMLEKAHVGNFVEMKKARLGVGAKAGHLTYLGDAEIGAGANIGAGVVTCNYDGQRKHRTEVGEGAFIGSDTMLVAPVSVGEGATTGAGSVINKDVPAGALGIARERQRTIADWAETQTARRRRDGAS
ncbi:MAG: bifunctional UDP-N-acetylglucosamine diphosphorylase/glucosamine-1-phosphate N-acetyltransferase GlmU [Acidobacteriota bacterium]